MKHKLDLERIVFIGRTYDEYVEMFSLKEEELDGKKILDCPSGACSFTAIGHLKGLDIIGCDIAYSFSPDQLHLKGLNDVEHAVISMEAVQDAYQWNYFKDIEELKIHRLKALNTCINHMKNNPERYIAATLPLLPFEDNEFDLTLSAHFLFMYSDRLNYSFHLHTLKELLRVTKDELRIFPLVDLKGEKYRHLHRLLDDIKDEVVFEEVRVNYEFQKQANTMLKIKKTY